MDVIDKLYENYEVISKAIDDKDVEKYEKEFLEVIAAVKGSDNEKRLASQFIVRFFKHFPALFDQAIDAQLDLCEDENVAIRKQAIKDIPSLCKDRPEYLPKLADVLAQLLQSNDASELVVVQNSLITLFQLDAKGTLGGVFSQIISGEDIVRERAIKFLLNKIKALAQDMSSETEEILISESKKALQDVTAEEFVMFMTILTNTGLSKSVAGQQQLIDLIQEQAELDKSLDTSEPENIDRLMQCARQAIPFYNSSVPSTKFFSYICEQVLPAMDRIQGNEEGIDVKLEIFKILAEMAQYAVKVDSCLEKLETLYSVLISYMPLPTMEENGENVENQTISDQPKFEFSCVEAMMYTFHKMAAKCPEFLSDHDDRLRDFRIRLQYFARGIQGYIKKLREALSGKTGQELKSEDDKIKVVALKTTSNINALIKDLFHTPPIYKSTIILSWRPASQLDSQRDSDGSLKRKPITFRDSHSPKLMKGEREIYIPPSGKFSDKVQGYSTRGRGWGRGSVGRFKRGRGSRKW